MPGRGLEPLRISPPDPKSGASADFATLAIGFLILDLRFAIARSAGFPASKCRSRQRLTLIATIASERLRTKLRLVMRESFLLRPPSRPRLSQPPRRQLSSSPRLRLQLRLDFCPRPQLRRDESCGNIR